VEDRVTKIQQQEETVELRRLGLEMTMELQTKRFEEQVMQLRFERERLDQWEQRVKGRDQQEGTEKRPTRNKSAQSKKRKSIGGTGKGDGKRELRDRSQIVENKENINMFVN
jgi:hypothetical protein